MKPSKFLTTAVLCGNLLLGGDAVLANSIETTPGARPDNFLLDAEHDYTVNELFTGEFYSYKSFDVDHAGRYELVLSDTTIGNNQPGSLLRKLTARVTTRDEKLANLHGAGSVLLDLQPGRYYLSLFAKAYAPDMGAGAGLTLRLREDTPTAVPEPAALWLFGSGLLGLAGSVRRRA